jgi:hypothetical protein
MQDSLERFLRTFVYSKKLAELQKTYEINCKALNITEEMFYFQTSANLHPFSSSLLYTLIDVTNEEFSSMLVRSVIRVMCETMKDEDNAAAEDGLLKFSGLIPLLKVLLVKKTLARKQFLSQGILLK